MIMDSLEMERTNIVMSARPEDVLLFNLYLDCISGQVLKASGAEDVLVEAKHESSGIWVDLQNDEISLTTWAGERELFNFRLTAPDIATQETYQFNIIVV